MELMEEVIRHERYISKKRLVLCECGTWIDDLHNGKHHSTFKHYKMIKKIDIEIREHQKTDKELKKHQQYNKDLKKHLSEWFYKKAQKDQCKMLKTEVIRKLKEIFIRTSLPPSS